MVLILSLFLSKKSSFKLLAAAEAYDDTAELATI
jgi:hypothetical protein